MTERMPILIAEDDEASRIYLTRVLEKAGYEVVAAEDGDMAWDLFQKNNFRLVITDWIMPRVGGVALCRRIREKATNGYVFVIMVTARDRKSDIVEAIDAGADDYVTKPYDKGELLARIRAGSRIISLEQELSEKNQELLKANITMKNDLLAASRLQQSFLPKAAPKASGLEFSWFYRPCDMVGGDTFNCFSINDNYVALYVLDVSGHGVPAAMLSVMLSRILTPHADRGGILCRLPEGNGRREPVSPRAIAQILNRRFPMDQDVGQYFTLLYLTFHLPSLTMKVVQAGHPYLAVLHHNGKVNFLRKAGFPIGMFEDADFEEETMSLSPGDRILLYSDGIVEAMNRQDECYGTDRFAKALATHRDQDISGITQAVMVDLANFIGDVKIIDDMTLVGLSIKPS